MGLAKRAFVLLLLISFCFENKSYLIYLIKFKKLSSENQIFLFQTSRVLLDTSEICHLSPIALEKEISKELEFVNHKPMSTSSCNHYDVTINSFFF